MLGLFLYNDGLARIRRITVTILARYILAADAAFANPPMPYQIGRFFSVIRNLVARWRRAISCLLFGIAKKIEQLLPAKVSGNAPPSPSRRGRTKPATSLRGETGLADAETHDHHPFG